MGLYTRLLKKDQDQLVKFFENLGGDLSIQTYQERVEAWGPDGAFVGGFYWSKKRRAWRFDSPRPYAHTVEDLGHLRDEYRRDRRGISQIEDAWDEFKQKPSQTRYKRYKGALAAFFLRLIA